MSLPSKPSSSGSLAATPLGLSLMIAFIVALMAAGLRWLGDGATLRFVHPWLGTVAALLLPSLALLAYRREAGGQRASLRFPSLGRLRRIRPGGAGSSRHVVGLLRVLAVALLVLALARPQSIHHFEEIITHGVDIALVIDVSGSMKAEDFKPHNRLHVAKETVKAFVRGRKHDRIGMVVFAGYAFTQCPLTLDYDVLLTFLDRLHVGTVEQDGTNIGMALATALNRLRDTKAKSKVVVLLTDGAHNVPGLDPVDAARLAQSIGVKVYTVGVGRDRYAPFAQNDPFFGKRLVWQPAELNEEVLRDIARITGGRYFRARDEQGLVDVFKQIDALEPSEVKAKQYQRHEELASWCMIPAALLLLFEAFLRHTRYRTIP